MDGHERTKGIRPDRLFLRPEPVEVKCVKCETVLETIPQDSPKEAIACKACGIIFDRHSGKVLHRDCLILGKGKLP